MALREPRWVRTAGRSVARRRLLRSAGTRTTTWSRGSSAAGQIVARACDGFVVSATHVPGAYEDFVRFVIPELQRRGLFRKEFAGTTLRDNLGIPVPPVGDWRHARTLAT